MRGRSVVSTITIIPYYRHTGPSQYLTHLHRELGRLSIDPDEIRDTFRQPMSEIAGWLDDPMTEGMRFLYDYRSLSFAKLIERMRQAGRDDWAGLPKPRIVISAEVTSKDNFSVRWEPGQISLRRSHVPAPEWMLEPNSDYAIGARPETELMFIRGFGLLRYALEDPERKAIAMLLLMATASAFNQLVERLKCHFDVQVLTRIELAFATSAETGVNIDSRYTDEVPVGWEIVDAIDELHTRLHVLIAEFCEKHGTTAESFWSVCDECRYPRGNLDREKASKRLRKIGKHHLTPKVVEDLFIDLTTAIEAGIWVSPIPKASAAGNSVIPFKHS
jgi:hypothetical protein